jgi:hypothetical protein
LRSLLPLPPRPSWSSPRSQIRWQSQLPPALRLQPAYSTDETTIGDLLDNKDTYAILKKYLPEIVDSDQVDLTRNMTLRQIQQYAPDEVTDAKLVEVDSEFAKLKAQQQ